METTVRDAPDQGRYEIVVDGEVAGVAEYDADGDQRTFTHTEVEPGHEGQGLGSRLVDGALADVAERGLSVVPVCSFVRDVITRHPDRYLGLVPADVRARMGLDAAS